MEGLLPQLSNACSNPGMGIADNADAGERWHPWRYMRDRYGHLTIVYPDRADDGCLGRWTGGTIEIDRTSNQAERRCTLTHEIIHLERGPVSRNPFLALREERIVECLTARRLISLERLVDALIWTRSRVDHDMAEELWVDLPTLQTRMATLTADERRYINQELARRQPWNN